MRLVISSRAYADPKNIYLYLSERDQAAAEWVVAESNGRFVYLKGFPHLGRPWPERDSQKRRLVAGAHLISYSEETNALLTSLCSSGASKSRRNC